MHEEDAFLRSALADAIAGGYRLRREAIREDAQATRWDERAAFAEARGLADLAEAALIRRGRHAHMADLLRRRAGEIQVEVERLRYNLRPAREGGRAPPPVDDLDARFAQLEIDRELDQLHARRAGRLPGDHQPESTPV